MTEARKEERVEKTLIFFNVNQSDFHKKAVLKFGIQNLRERQNYLKFQ